MIEQPKDDRTDFYNTYVLLLWLSIIVYMPFNIADFDATLNAAEGVSSKATVLHRCELCCFYLQYYHIRFMYFL